MFRPFRRKKKEMMSMELSVHNYNNMINNTYEIPTQSIDHPDSKTARLMELISYAIEDWAAEYHLENLPKKIVFEQALDAMRALEQVMNSTEH